MRFSLTPALSLRERGNVGSAMDWLRRASSIQPSLANAWQSSAAVPVETQDESERLPLLGGEAWGEGKPAEIEPRRSLRIPLSICIRDPVAAFGLPSCKQSRRLESRSSTIRHSSFVILALLTGCTPDTASDVTPLDSKLFSAVQVIGSRGVAPGQFNKPRSLTCDRDDNLYVADITGRIQKFSPEGRFLLQWQMPQTDLGKPKGMGLDREGHVLVIEPHYMRVNHFTANGELVRQWGVKGTNAGEFILPRGVAQNAHGEFYLSEYTLVDRVQRFSVGPAVGLSGGCVPVRSFLTNAPGGLAACPTSVWGTPGDGPGQFSRAEGLCIGRHDEVLVADSCNHRVQVFDREGKFLRAFGRAGSNPGEFSYPYDVRVDPAGNQFICEFGNSRITVLNAQDQVVEIIGNAGAAPGKFANPWAICFDSKGNLYVADSQNHRVQKLVRRKVF